MTTVGTQRNFNRHNIRGILRMVKVFGYVGTIYVTSILENENKKLHVLF
jgi:hypothetical protein